MFVCPCVFVCLYTYNIVSLCVRGQRQQPQNMILLIKSSTSALVPNRFLFYKEIAENSKIYINSIFELFFLAMTAHMSLTYVDVIRHFVLVIFNQHKRYACFFF